jgi:hypothetical protein
VDVGNPDPSPTGGKDPERAKALELAGWDYPRHLAGRVFSAVVHGDAAGVGTLRRRLTNWLTDMELIEAGNLSQLGAYVGYLRPCATSHEDLDRDSDFLGRGPQPARSLPPCSNCGVASSSSPTRASMSRGRSEGSSPPVQVANGVPRMDIRYGILCGSVDDRR